MKILVGYTGFVGSNLYDLHKFDNVYNSKNINRAFGSKPDLCVYAGVKAEKFIAANNPEADRQLIFDAIENIKNIKPKKIILISTIDVYKIPMNVNENSLIDTTEAHPYGVNRYYLEQWIRENIDDHLIIRLPALFGKNIKKNFIYDIINEIPSLLNEEKYQFLSALDRLISENYIKQDNGFYKCIVTTDKKNHLKQAFKSIGFSALNFTDSRAVYQFYYLKYLWDHIQVALENKLQLVNFATEPLSVYDIYKSINGNIFLNEITRNIPHYDFKTIYAGLFGGGNGYILSKERVLKDINHFIKNSID
jgi:hypothetical protein